MTRVFGGLPSYTATGDWLIDYHPRYNKSLFLATGESGHAFKFLPVIGDKVVECLVGKYPEEFRDKWRWREAVAYEEWPGDDGSKGGWFWKRNCGEMERKSLNKRSNRPFNILSPSFFTPSTCLVCLTSSHRLTQLEYASNPYA